MYIYTYEVAEGTVVALGLTAQERDDLQEWCRSAYNERGIRYSESLRFGEILFQDQKDLMLFLLRWCHAI